MLVDKRQRCFYWHSHFSKLDALGFEGVIKVVQENDNHPRMLVVRKPLLELKSRHRSTVEFV